MRTTHSSKFQPIRWEPYLRRTQGEIEYVRSPELRGRMQNLVATSIHGRAAVDGIVLGKKPGVPKIFSPLYWAKKVYWALTGRRTGKTWLFFARNFGFRPPGVNKFTFESREQAIDYILTYPRRKSTGGEHLEFLKPRFLPPIDCGERIP